MVRFWFLRKACWGVSISCLTIAFAATGSKDGNVVVVVANRKNRRFVLGYIFFTTISDPFYVGGRPQWRYDGDDNRQWVTINL